MKITRKSSDLVLKIHGQLRILENVGSVSKNAVTENSRGGLKFREIRHVVITCQPASNALRDVFDRFTSSLTVFPKQLIVCRLQKYGPVRAPGL